MSQIITGLGIKSASDGKNIVNDITMRNLKLAKVKDLFMIQGMLENIKEEVIASSPYEKSMVDKDYLVEVSDKILNGEIVVNDTESALMFYGLLDFGLDLNCKEKNNLSFIKNLNRAKTKLKKLFPVKNRRHTKKNPIKITFDPDYFPNGVSDEEML